MVLTLLTLVVSSLALAVPGVAIAQSANTPGAARVELAAAVDVASAPVVLASCCSLRTPPTFTETEDKFKRVSLGGELRVYWAPRLSLVLAASASRNADHVVEYPPSTTLPSPFPGSPPSRLISRTASRSGWSASVIQSVDVGEKGRLRPWLGGGILFERVSDHYGQLSLPPATDTAQVFNDHRSQMLTAVVASGGVRVDLSRRLFVAASGALRLYFRTEPFSSSPASGRVGVGIRF